MKRIAILIASTTALLAGNAFAGDVASDDLPLAFQRMLEDQGAHFASHHPQYVASGESDPYRLPSARAMAGSSDPIAASFDRLLTHEAYNGPTAITVSQYQDHRVERIMHAMLHYRSEPVFLAGK